MSITGSVARPHSIEVTVKAIIAITNRRRRPYRPPSVAAVSSVHANDNV